MKIVSPEHGAYFWDSEGRIRVTPTIYGVSAFEIVSIAIPPETIPVLINDEASIPVDSGWRKAIYKRAEIPNCRGIARYQLKRVE